MGCANSSPSDHEHPSPEHSERGTYHYDNNNNTLTHPDDADGGQDFHPVAGDATADPHTQHRHGRHQQRATSDRNDNNAGLMLPEPALQPPSAAVVGDSGPHATSTMALSRSYTAATAADTSRTFSSVTFSALPSPAGVGSEPSVPLTERNVTAHTDLEIRRLHERIAAGGPMVMGFPRTWQETMEQWQMTVEQPLPEQEP